MINTTTTTPHRQLLTDCNVRQKIHRIMFGVDTPAGKVFDIGLLVCIVLSIIAVMLESVESIDSVFSYELMIVEWFFTILFSIEYLLRIYTSKKPLRYMTSFFGVIDLLAIIPTYLSYFVLGSHYFVVVRAMRLLRIFRIFKLARFVKESTMLTEALRASQAKILVFLIAVLMATCVIGSVMYVVETGTNSDFTSIPKSIYWAIVTITTVGYGDISPVTPLGQFLAAMLMIIGYGVIAVPTGIVTAELSKPANATYEEEENFPCPSCGEIGHDIDAHFCKYCGEKLSE